MEQKKPTPQRSTAQAPAMNRQQRRAQARRNRRRKKAVIAAALVLLAALAIRAAIKTNDGPDPAEAPVIEAPAPEEKSEIVPLVLVEQKAPDYSGLLGDIVDLGMEQQKIVFQVCNEDVKLFCTVMAIAHQESNFNPDALGDYGKSCGMMQINMSAQGQRVADLGIYDIMDLRQNVTVAVDYIIDVANALAPEDGYYTYGTEGLFMAYNMGIRGYLDACASGTTSTAYSAACERDFKAYLNYMMTEANAE